MGNNNKEKPALLVLNDLLTQKAGLSQKEVDFLLARFLEEEAEDYLRTMKTVKES